MSTRAAKPGLGWVANVASQMTAVAAVPVVIVLAMALKPQPDVRRRTEPLWHNQAHARNCPACQLQIRRATARREPLPVEPLSSEPVVSPVDSALGSAALLGEEDSIEEKPRPSSVL
jgi:hypothetical protein